MSGIDAMSSLGSEILAKAREALQEISVDVLVATSPENVTYLSGAAPPSQRTVRSRLAAAIVPASAADDEVVVVDLEGPLVEAHSWLRRVRRYAEFVEHPVDVIAASLEERGLDSARIGFEASYMSQADVERLRAALPQGVLVPADELLASLRMFKTSGEIELIRRIGQVAERIQVESVTEVAAGDTEQDLALLLSERYANGGGDALTMLVVASGERSAHPNGPPTSRRMAPGELVRLDVIGTGGHYCSDVARTAVVGEPTAEQARVYSLLAEVHERCIEAIRPGVSTAKIYEIYREAVLVANLPAYHFVGHGLGLTLHEQPFLGVASDSVLAEGMVLCIEPLTFVEGRFGIQIEDELLVTADGCERFTEAGDMLRIPA